MKKRNEQSVVKVWTVNDKAVRYMIRFLRVRKIKYEDDTVQEKICEFDFDYLATKNDIEIILDFEELENCKLDTRGHIVVDRKVPREELTIDKLLSFTDKYKHYASEYDSLLNDYNKLVDDYNKLLDKNKKLTNQG